MIKQAKFKDFTREEFDKNYVYGLDPIVDGLEYRECTDTCKIPKDMSGRAARIGNDLIQQYHDNCMRSAKVFNNWERRWEVYQLVEVKCAVLKKKNNIFFLDKMKTQLKEYEEEIFKLR